MEISIIYGDLETRKAVIRLAAINALIMFIFGLTYPVVLLYLVGHKGFDAFESGVVASLSSFVSFVSNIACGYILNMFRKKASIFIGIGGLIMALFFALASMYSEDIILLSMFFSLAGIGSSCILVSSASMILETSTNENIGRGMGVFGQQAL